MREVNKGFTLVELLIVIAIIAILVLMVIIAINPVRVIEDTRDTRNRTEMNQLKTSLQLYFNDNKRYPTATSCKPNSLTPAYTRALPNVTNVTNFCYGVSGTGDDYDAKVPMSHHTSDDDATVTKCMLDTTDYVTGAAGDYMVCPD